MQSISIVTGLHERHNWSIRILKHSVSDLVLKASISNVISHLVIETGVESPQVEGCVEKPLVHLVLRRSVGRISGIGEAFVAAGFCSDHQPLVDGLEGAAKFSDPQTVEEVEEVSLAQWVMFEFGAHINSATFKFR